MTEASAVSLFTDLAGSAGDSAFAERHHRAAALVLRRIGKAQPSAMPSGVAATLSDAGRALICAVQIQRSFENWGRPGNAPVRVGLGLDHDEAEHVAARAAGGDILVTEAVRALAEPRGHLFTARGDLQLRGASLPLFAVRWWEHD